MKIYSNFFFFYFVVHFAYLWNKQENCSSNLQKPSYLCGTILLRYTAATQIEEYSIRQ